MASTSGSTLQKMREIQTITAPDMCLGACKFLALKIAGLLDPVSHLNDFLKSPWALAHAALKPANCWGWTMSEYNDDFNKKVLPAALNDSTGKVKNSALGGADARFVYFSNQTSVADRLLQNGIPLVVGVSLFGGVARDHMVVVVQGSDGAKWVVDPWPGAATDAVRKLPKDFSFAKPYLIHLTADAVKTRIPCGVPFFGYFRDADLESRYAFPAQ